ncbi:MAG: hypothetical protein IT462_11895 [Planctomycetes bacterium]|nr:hypothetical protein [Planctomycetota bacterium]
MTMLEREIRDDSGRLRQRWEVRIDSGVEIRHGLYESRHENGRIAERGRYRDGEKDGLWELWHEESETKFAEKTFHRGVAHGRWMNYYLDGTPKCERFFVDGVEHGTRTTHYTRGITWIEEYAGGLKHGLCVELDKFGAIVAQRRYHHGAEI